MSIPEKPVTEGRYFLVGPGNKVVVVTRELFEVVEQFLKPNKRLGIVEITFKSGGICGIRKIEHVL